MNAPHLRVQRFVEGAPVQNHTVLFVDDEVNILKALQRLLRNEPIDVLTANSPSEAFELIERAGPQVIVSDQRMPEMSALREGGATGRAPRQHTA